MNFFQYLNPSNVMNGLNYLFGGSQQQPPPDPTAMHIPMGTSPNGLNIQGGGGGDYGNDPQLQGGYPDYGPAPEQNPQNTGGIAQNQAMPPQPNSLYNPQPNYFTPGQPTYPRWNMFPSSGIDQPVTPRSSGPVGSPLLSANPWYGSNTPPPQTYFQ